MDSSSDHSKSEKLSYAAHTVAVKDVDTAAELNAGTDIHLDPQVAAALRRKIDWHLMPLMGILYLMTFADKTTLGQSAVLGIIPDAKLTTNQFNWLGAVFSLSYLVFQYPQNLALQRYPVGKWMSINIFIWAIALCAHAACKNFASLFVVRFILGACEGAITPGFLIVTSMFYTRQEQTRRVGYWFLMNGFAIIFLGLVSFGVLQSKVKGFAPWQFLMIITGGLTLITAVVFWFLFPDSPTTAKFLTPEERKLAVERIRSNQTGLENKTWKKDQFIEAITDSRVWLMALFAAATNITNSLINQRQLIIRQFGFSPINTTLLGCVDGVVEIVTVWAGVMLASTKLGRGYAGFIMFIPGIMGALLVNLLPSGNKVGLLFGYWLSIFSITPFAIFLGWVSALTSGHTKRITTNALVLIGFSAGNFASPFAWQRKYQPRNHIPWWILTAGMIFSAFLMLFIRYLFARENERRDVQAGAAESDEYDDVYISQLGEDGSKQQKRVDRAFLDLTDKQNSKFRYIL